MNAYKIKDEVYHPSDAAPFIVTAIRRDKIRIKGDWSGGTAAINVNSWVGIDEIKPYDRSKVTYYFGGKPYRMVKK